MSCSQRAYEESQSSPLYSKCFFPKLVPFELPMRVFASWKDETLLKWPKNLAGKFKEIQNLKIPQLYGFTSRESDIPLKER